MSSSRSAASPNPVGLWFCQISAGLQGRWQSGRAEPLGAKNDAGGAETAAQARAAAAAGSRDGPPMMRAAPAACRREALTEATVYLLLDRFAPS